MSAAAVAGIDAMHPAIDVHSHMLCIEWLDLIRTHGGPKFTVAEVADTGKTWIHLDGVRFMFPQPEMFDYDQRLAAMDAAGVAVAVLSLTGPNVYWGDAAVSVQAARVMNASFAQAQRAHPQRFRWLASLPFQYPRQALDELAQAVDEGAVGVMVLSTIAGMPLTDPAFAPVWQEIERRALPVFMHPTVCSCAGMEVFQLTASVAYPSETALAVARMMMDGFFERYPRLALVLAHGGGTLGALLPRLDRCHAAYAEARSRVDAPPSRFVSRLYVDSVLYSDRALADALETFGTDHVLFGSDFPHAIADLDGTLARIGRLRAEVRDRVRGANAVALFDIDLATLPPSTAT
ncbi:MAG: amidohydrolase [Proteobacteria bacterium]|nr:amidohydrolase [Burkholderiales bacterium]